MDLSYLQGLIQNPMDIALILIIIALIWILIRLQRGKKGRGKVDLRWMILDERTKHPSLHKFGQLVALLISSWAFIYETLHGHLTDGFMLAYMGAWTAAVAANQYIGKINGPRDDADSIKSPNQ